MGLNLAKNLNGLKKKNFGWVRLGPKRLNRARGTGLGPEKKTRLIIGPNPGRGSWPAGRVRVCQNPARCHSYSNVRRLPLFLNPFAVKQANILLFKKYSFYRNKEIIYIYIYILYDYKSIW